MNIEIAVKIIEQMENDVENLCHCCMPKGTSCIGCRETAITTILNELKKKQDVIDKAIEYVENNTYSSACTLKTTLHLQDDELYELLEILKEVK